MDYTDRDDIRQMLADIKSRQSRVRKWDVKFINTVAKKFHSEIDLTMEESERLVSIWDRVTEEG